MQDFKLNYGNKYKISTKCKLGCSHEDNQENIVSCPILKQKLPDLETENISYRDIFSNNIRKVVSTANVLSKLLSKRLELLRGDDDVTE